MFRGLTCAREASQALLPVWWSGSVVSEVHDWIKVADMALHASLLSFSAVSPSHRYVGISRQRMSVEYNWNSYVLSWPWLNVCFIFKSLNCLFVFHFFKEKIFSTCLLTLRPLCFLLPNVPPAASPACRPHQRQQEVQPLSSRQPKLFWEEKKIERTRRGKRQDPWAIALTSTETSPCRLTLPGILRTATKLRLLLFSKMNPGRKIVYWGYRRISSWSVKVGLRQVSTRWLFTQTDFVFLSWHLMTPTLVVHMTTFLSSIKIDIVNYSVIMFLIYAKGMT